MHIGLTIPAIIIPTRFFSYWYILYRGLDRYKKDIYHYPDDSYYKPLFINLLYALGDLIIIPIGIISFILPTRIPTLIYLWARFIYQCFSTLPCCWPQKQPQQQQEQEQQEQKEPEQQQQDVKDDTLYSEYYDIFKLDANTFAFERYKEFRYNYDFRISLLKQLYLGIGDVMAILIGLPSILVLSPSWSYLKCILYMFDFPMFGWHLHFINKYGNLQHHHIWTCCVKNLFYSLLDLLVYLIFLIFAIITSPISLFHAMKTYGYNVEDKLKRIKSDANHLDEYKYDNYIECLLQYNWNLRWVILKLGFWGFLQIYCLVF